MKIVKRLFLSSFILMLAFTGLSAAAGPIVVTLSGVLGGDTPLGSSGSQYSLSFQLDDSAQPISSSATSATYSGVVSRFSFSSENGTFDGPPTNTQPDSNLIVVSNNSGTNFSEDVIQAFFDIPDQGGFSDLFFGFQLLDRHDNTELAPESITSLGLDLFSLLDVADFARDSVGPLIANNQLVFNGLFNGTEFSDFNAMITSIAVTPGLAVVPTPPPAVVAPQPPQGSVSVPEPGMGALLFIGAAFGLMRRFASGPLLKNGLKPGLLVALWTTLNPKSHETYPV